MEQPTTTETPTTDNSVETPTHISETVEQPTTVPIDEGNSLSLNQKNYRIDIPRCHCTLALISKQNGKPTPISLLACRPQVAQDETPEDIERIFKFSEWPIELKVEGVCPARDIISQYTDCCRIIRFSVLHEDVSPPDPGSPPAPNGGQPTKWAGTVGVVQQNTLEKRDTPQNTTTETYMKLMLKQLHEKGLAATVNLKSNTLLIISHNGIPLGILLPKLQLKTKSGDNNPPPIIGSLCIMCRVCPATHAFIKCGHLCICSEDLKIYMSSEKGKNELCPVCNSQYENVIRIYGV